MECWKCKSDVAKMPIAVCEPFVAGRTFSSLARSALIVIALAKVFNLVIPAQNPYHPRIKGAIFEGRSIAVNIVKISCGDLYHGLVHNLLVGSLRRLAAHQTSW